MKQSGSGFHVLELAFEHAEEILLPDSVGVLVSIVFGSTVVQPLICK